MMFSSIGDCCKKYDESNPYQGSPEFARSFSVEPYTVLWLAEGRFLSKTIAI